MYDKKIEELETALAHHEQQIHDLSGMINEQWRQIEMLTQRLEMTQSRLRMLEATGGESDEDSNMTVTEIAARDKPPHYYAHA